MVAELELAPTCIQVLAGLLGSHMTVGKEPTSDPSMWRDAAPPRALVAGLP